MLYSYIESLFSSNEPLRQSFGWESIDFAAHPAAALIITFFIAVGFRNRFLSRAASALILSAIAFLMLRGAAFNNNNMELLDCGLISTAHTEIAARPATAYRLNRCETAAITPVDFDKTPGADLKRFGLIILRNDDAWSGYLKESGEWKVVATSASKNSFLRGFGDFDLRFEIFQPNS